MKKIQKCTKSTCKNVQKTSKTSIIVPKPDIISLKTSQDISLVNVTSAFLAQKMGCSILKFSTKLYLKLFGNNFFYDFGIVEVKKSFWIFTCEGKEA